MGKKIFVLMFIVTFAISLAACGSGGQASDSSSVGLDWPSQYMSTLPAPESKISSIDKLNGTESIAAEDTTTQPSSVNVVMNEMTMDEASAYYDKLKAAGFTINTNQKDNEKILLVGTLNDAEKNPFLFNYTAKDNFGNVSITIMKAAQ